MTGAVAPTKTPIPEIISIELGDGRTATAKLLRPGVRSVSIGDQAYGEIVCVSKGFWGFSPNNHNYRSGTAKTREEAAKSLVTMAEQITAERDAESAALKKKAEEEKVARGAPIPKGKDLSTNPKFMKWFEGSKIVGKDGKPLRVFRGSRTEFTKTKLSSLSFTEDPDIASIYASKLDDYGYSADYVDGSSVSAFYLSIKNPVVVKKSQISEKDLQEMMPGVTESDLKRIRYDLRSRTGAAYKSVNRGGEEHNDAFAVIDTKAFVEVAKRLGFDGVIHKDVFQSGKNHSKKLLGKPAEHLRLGRGDTHITYRPFSASQAKSATGNKGEFHPEGGVTESRTSKPWWSI